MLIKLDCRSCRRRLGVGVGRPCRSFQKILEAHKLRGREIWRLFQEAPLGDTPTILQQPKWSLATPDATHILGGQQTKCFSGGIPLGPQRK